MNDVTFGDWSVWPATRPWSSLRHLSVRAVQPYRGISMPTRFLSRVHNDMAEQWRADVSDVSRSDDIVRHASSSTSTLQRDWSLDDAVLIQMWLVLKRCVFFVLKQQNETRFFQRIFWAGTVISFFLASCSKNVTPAVIYCNWHILVDYNEYESTVYEWSVLRHVHRICVACWRLTNSAFLLISSSVLLIHGLVF